MIWDEMEMEWQGVWYGMDVMDGLGIGDCLSDLRDLASKVRASIVIVV